MRGIGSITQDVNVSITGHPRVELKGVQELPHMPEIVKKEIERQQEVIKKGEKIEQHVRNILPDLSSKFLRPITGAARMYPETDIPLIKIDKERVARMKIPESFEDKEKKFIKLGLSEDLAKQVVHDVRFSFIESLFSKFKNVKTSVIASAIFSTESEVKRKTGKEVKFTDEQYDEVLNLLDKGKVAKEAVLDVFIDLSKGEKLDDITNKFAKFSDSDLKKEIDKLKAQFEDIPREKLQGVIMGKLRGKADPKKIIELLK
jgi:glutamyl-tRNA(Gln) amidotransferase subunit E